MRPILRFILKRPVSVLQVTNKRTIPKIRSPQPTVSQVCVMGHRIGGGVGRARVRGGEGRGVWVVLSK